MVKSKFRIDRHATHNDVQHQDVHALQRKPSSAVAVPFKYFSLLFLVVVVVVVVAWGVEGSE